MPRTRQLLSTTAIALCCVTGGLRPIAAEDAIAPPNGGDVKMLFEQSVVVVRDGQEVVERQIIVLRANRLVNVRTISQKWREHFEKVLDEQILALDAGYSLTDTQKRKLSLAGRGDIRQYGERLEDLSMPRGEIREGDRQVMAALEKQMHELAVFQSQSDPFGDESLFQKTMRGILTPGQLADAAYLTSACQVAAHIASWDELTKGIKLTPEIRHKLAWLVATKSTPPRGHSRDPYYVVLLQLAYLKDEVRPLFSKAEWPAIERELEQARGLEPYLRKIGVWPVRGPADDDR